MKKFIAGAATVAALSLGAAGIAAPAHAGYVVHPSGHSSATVVGHELKITFDSGIVGLAANGKVYWVFVKTPKGVHKPHHKKHWKTVSNSSTSLNLRGHAFPKPGHYKIRFYVNGVAYTFKITVGNPPA